MKEIFDSNEIIFIILNTTFVIFYISTYILNISIGHIFALIISIILLIVFLYYTKNSISLSNEILEYKMNTLDSTYKPDFMYLEPDFIILYDSFTTTIPEYNKKVFLDIIRLTDKLIKLVYITGLNIKEQPITPDIYLGEIDYVFTNKNVTYDIKVLDKYKNISEEILNKTNGLIMYSTILTPNIEYNFLNFLTKLQSLIKINYNKVVNNITNNKINIQDLQKQGMQLHFGVNKQKENIDRLIQTKMYKF